MHKFHRYTEHDIILQKKNEENEHHKMCKTYFKALRHKHYNSLCNLNSVMTHCVYNEYRQSQKEKKERERKTVHPVLTSRRGQAQSQSQRIGMLTCSETKLEEATRMVNR